jgi:hypothetical protein
MRKIQFVCFVCRADVRGPEQLSVWLLVRHAQRAYGLCTHCFPAWVVAAAVLECGAERGPTEQSCFFCPRTTYGTCVLYDWPGCGWPPRPASMGGGVAVCGDCRLGRLEEARQLALASTGTEAT